MLEQIFLNQQLGPLGLTNFLRYMLQALVNQGYPLEVLILILLLPLAATLVALARYLVGIQGLGTFIPMMLGIIFLSTGFWPGLLLFISILLIETIVILILRRLKVHFMAKMALVLLVVCLTLLSLLLLHLPFDTTILFNSSLIPILVLILIGENTTEAQLKKTPRKAIRGIIETFVLSFLAFFVLNSIILKKMMLLYPEMMIILTATLNIWIGQFTGLRLLEYRRFRKLIKK